MQRVYGRIAPRGMVTMTIHSLALQQETHKAAHRQTRSIPSSQMTGNPESSEQTREEREITAWLLEIPRNALHWDCWLWTQRKPT